MTVGPSPTRHAWDRLRAAQQLLAAHRPAGALTCTCGRALPCPHARTLAAARDRCLREIRWRERTRDLPVVRASVPEPRHPGAAGLLPRLWRRVRRRDRTAGGGDDPWRSTAPR